MKRPFEITFPDGMVGKDEETITFPSGTVGGRGRQR